LQTTISFANISHLDLTLTLSIEVHDIVPSTDLTEAYRHWTEINGYKSNNTIRRFICK
jgi:hypothetical protein